MSKDVSGFWSKPSEDINVKVRLYFVVGIVS